MSAGRKWNSLLLFLATFTLELERPPRSEREVGHDARRGCPESMLGPSWRSKVSSTFDLHRRLSDVLRFPYLGQNTSSIIYPEIEEFPPRESSGARYFLCSGTRSYTRWLGQVVTNSELNRLETPV